MAHRFPRWLVGIYTSPWAAIAIFAVLGFIATLHHTLWRDEMNVWLVVRDSPSFAALIENIHYDRAHPGLWHLAVAALHSLFKAPVAMQLFHWLLGVSSLVLFWRYSPFSQLQKWLFTFGYLPFYEYLLIARNYALGMFLLFALCTLWPTRRRAYWPIAGLIALLANSHVYALWIAIALSLTLAFEILFDTKLRRNWLDLLGSGLLILLGCAVSLYFILPPSDVANSALGETFFYFDLDRLMRTIGRFFAGYYTVIPNSKRTIDVTVCALIAIAACLLTLLRLIKKPYALTFYGLANSLILGFTYVQFMPRFIRHFGNLYLVLLAALWLAPSYSTSTALTRRLPSLEKWEIHSQRWFRYMILTTLLFHLGGGLYRFSADLAVPNSAGRAAAAYIRKAGLQNEFIVGSRDAEMAPLSGYLGRSLYYPERQALGSYTLFFKGDRQDVDQGEVLRQVTRLLSEHPRILLVLSDELAVSAPELIIESLASFERSQNEQYYLYWVKATANG
ncbi:hypothetical protein PN498_04650 [Oscillatoria sp. CS-180]|uniref:hypothetical protein n=1 Tax=Oscillatoria sp. CS-180 TaxID=3021720 RepID=UPI00232A9CEF|nr:hypothetical protein [Oscillatoria sp. CS-180]MDB9525267.1 hypothetical protein [Oscillatoria sp. CS-180]